MSIISSYQIRVLESADELYPIENLTDEIWHGGAEDIVPTHMLTAFVHNGGLAIGAFEDDKMIAFAFGFPGIYHSSQGLKTKHSSHQMGVHPDHRGKNIGFALKQAQWQMVRQQGLDLITWTYDPLLSRNAYLNIAQLGAVSNTYKRDEYGEMVDGLNAGVASDRFQVDWWLNTPRVFQRLDTGNWVALGLENYRVAEAQMLYTPETNADLGLLLAPKHYSPPNNKFLLLQIPNDYHKLRAVDLPLAKDWRFFTREVFEDVFRAGYIVTDFIYDRSEAIPHSFYLLTDGESRIG